jgi:hypothetical protein
MVVVDVTGELTKGGKLGRNDSVPAAESQETGFGLVYAARAGAEVEDVRERDAGGECCFEQTLAGVMRAEGREEELSQVSGLRSGVGGQESRPVTQ